MGMPNEEQKEKDLLDAAKKSSKIIEDFYGNELQPFLKKYGKFIELPSFMKGLLKVPEVQENADDKVDEKTNDDKLEKTEEKVDNKENDNVEVKAKHLKGKKKTGNLR